MINEKKTQLALKKYGDPLSRSISEYFEALEKDEKPKIHIEIYSSVDSERHQATIRKQRSDEP